VIQHADGPPAERWRPIAHLAAEEVRVRLAALLPDRLIDAVLTARS
jgi:hypothetical protein